MTRRLISSGTVFEEQIGYSRAVVAGDWVFVSGTTGFDYKTMSISENAVGFILAFVLVSTSAHPLTNWRSGVL